MVRAIESTLGWIEIFFLEESAQTIGSNHYIQNIPTYIEAIFKKIQVIMCWIIVLGDIKVEIGLKRR